MFRFLHIIPCFWPFLQYPPLKQYQQLLVSIKKTRISRDTTKLESYRESLYLKEAFLIWLLYVLLEDSLVYQEFLRSLSSLWYTHNFSGEWSFSLSAEAIFDFLRRAKLGEYQEQTLGWKGKKWIGLGEKGRKLCCFLSYPPSSPLNACYSLFITSVLLTKRTEPRALDWTQLNPCCCFLIQCKMGINVTASTRDEPVSKPGKAVI